MKKILYTLIISQLLFAILVKAQNGAAINSSGVAADPSAMLDVSSTNSGILIPRMTTAERNAIANPAIGLQIINITTNCIEVYFNSLWQQVFCSCNPPTASSAGVHIPYQTEISWNWNSVSGAMGYKYNTLNDYATATDNGVSTTYNQQSLICNTPYTLYVWAYSTCGQSPAIILTATTSSCGFNCGSNVTFTYNGSQVTYGTLQGQNGTCWMDRNLGAVAVATAHNHTAGYGDLFQWGRSDDGHQARNSGITSVLSTTNNPGHNMYISCGSLSGWNWRTPHENNLWQGVSGINNPCPNGWRLPVESELSNEMNSWTGGNNYYGAIQSPLAIPTAGLRDPDGNLTLVDSFGFYWTSTTDGSNRSRELRFYDSGAFILSQDRGFGYSVRCIKE